MSEHKDALAFAGAAATLVGDIWRDKYHSMIAEKDAEIDRLEAELQQAKTICPLCEKNTPFGDLIVCIECAGKLGDIDRLKAELEVAQTEVNRLRHYEDAVTDAIEGKLLVYNFQDTNCTVIKHRYWLAHLEEISQLRDELEVAGNKLIKYRDRIQNLECQLDASQRCLS